MQVTIKRTGGYAGFDETVVTRDLDGMPGRKRSAVLKRLRNLGKSSSATDGTIGADMLTYEIEVEEVPDVPEHISVVDSGDADDKRLQELTSLIEALS